MLIRRIDWSTSLLISLIVVLADWCMSKPVRNSLGSFFYGFQVFDQESMVFRIFFSFSQLAHQDVWLLSWLTVSISSWILITLATCRKLSTKDVGISNNLYDRASFKCSIDRREGSITRLPSLDVDIHSTSFLEIPLWKVL